MAAVNLLSNAIDPGELRDRVDLYALAVDESGEPLLDAMNAVVTDLQPFAQGVYARVLEQTGQARYATEQFVDRMSHVITIRWRRNVARGMQVRWSGRAFDVKYVIDPEQRRRWLHLLCLEDGL